MTDPYAGTAARTPDPEEFGDDEDFSEFRQREIINDLRRPMGEPDFQGVVGVISFRDRKSNEVVTCRIQAGTDGIPAGLIWAFIERDEPEALEADKESARFMLKLLHDRGVDVKELLPDGS